MKTKMLILVIFLFAGMYSANAQNVRVHQKVQKHRIKDGVKDGAITKGEMKVLKHERKDVRLDAKILKMNDGKLSHPERRYIRHEQMKNSRHIYRSKHNNRDRK